MFDERNINSRKMNYHIRLISNPKKTIKRGGESTRKRTLAMILNGVDEMTESRGIFEALTTLGGKNLRHWEKAGTFTEQHTTKYNEDSENNYLELRLKGMKIQLNEYHDYLGTVLRSGIIKKRRHFYRGWKNIILKDVSVYKDRRNQ